MREILHMVVVLFLTAAVSGGALALVYNGTKDTIAEQTLKNVKEPAIREIFDGLDNDPVAERMEIPVGEDQIVVAFPAKQGGQLMGVAVEGSGKGYGGAVNVMVGIGTDGTLKGIGITGHSETPGLGARSTEPAFRDQFQGMAYEGGVGGKVEAISGATITTGAVISAVDQAVAVYEANEDELTK